MINGEMKKVTKREAHKWNDTGTGQHDDATFAKLDAEVCAYSMIESTSVHWRDLLESLAPPPALHARRSSPCWLPR
jgi:hypothetical protein